MSVADADDLPRQLIVVVARGGAQLRALAGRTAPTATTAAAATAATAAAVAAATTAVAAAAAAATAAAAAVVRIDRRRLRTRLAVEMIPACRMLPDAATARD